MIKKVFKLSSSYQQIWNVSFPIILSGVAQNIVNVTDTAFLSRLGIVELGAAGNAGIFYFVLMMFGMGYTIGTQILIARRNGEKQLKAIAPLFYHSGIFMLFLSIILFLFFYYLSVPFLESITKSTAILKASLEYIQVRAFGIPFAFLGFLCIAFFTGTLQTKVLIQVTFTQAMVNVILDYFLIFGNYGFPEMGIQGAALASVISEIVAFLYFLVHGILKLDLNAFGLRDNFVFKGLTIIQTLKLSLPIMIQNLIALGTWLAFFTIIEQMGERELGISHIIRSIYMVLMIPLFGFSSATNTLVSNLIGENKVSTVIPLVKKIAILSLACTFIFLPLVYGIPEILISFYTTDTSLIHEATSVLYVIGGAMLFFSIAYISFSAVTGTGNTKKSLLIEVSSISIYLSSAYLMGVYLTLPLPTVWCAEFIYFGCMGAFSILYLHFGNWHQKKI